MNMKYRNQKLKHYSWNGFISDLLIAWPTCGGCDARFSLAAFAAFPFWLRRKLRKETKLDNIHVIWFGEWENFLFLKVTMTLPLRELIPPAA